MPTRPALTMRDLEANVRLLEQELADTNREVLALTLELDRRLEELGAAEERYRRLAENAPDVIMRCEISPMLFCSFVNPRVTDLTGYLPDELYSDPGLLIRMVHPEDRQAAEALLRGEGPDSGMYTLRWLHKGGATVWIEQRYNTVREGGRLICIECIARDITARRQLEEQFFQSQKMEAIGRLAGGVAHDFNNLLTVINGYSSMALETLEEANPLHLDLQEVVKAGERAASLTGQLLAFSRRQAVTPRVLDLNEVVSDMERMLRRILGEDVTLHTVLAAGLEPLVADRGQIEQVVMNLAVNARDAMAEGGQLWIETSNSDFNEELAREQHMAPGRYVTLVVKDAGCGMDAETLAHVFEPFFTTKGPGRGTGLGLAVVFGIVQQSGGTIRIDSEPARGTTFQLYFPSAGDHPVSVEPAAAASGTRGSETILVVEDEAGVRNLIRSSLQRAGYTVLEARGGSEAMQLYEQQGSSIDLVLTDVVMPDMGGQELAARLSALRSGVPILFMSGYNPKAAGEAGASGALTPFLAKPFTTGALTAKIRETLDRGA